jgi:hypothetical protein
MFLEVLVSCLAGPDEFILWQAHQTLVMLIRAIFFDHCQFEHFAQMISLITFDLLLGYRLYLNPFVAMEEKFPPTLRSAYDLSLSCGTGWVFTVKV